MLRLDRRSFMAAATAGAVLGLSKSVEIIPPATAQSADASPLNPKALRFHKFKIGDIDATTVTDGSMSREHAPGFVKNASVDEIKASLKAAAMPDDRLPNSYTVTIVRIGDRTIMFDSGNGAGRTPGIGLLQANMKAAGIEPASLTAIVVTHFHPDHIYGLYGPDDAPLYANLEVVVPEAEYKYWADPAVIEALPESRRGIARRVQASMPKWKSLRQVSAGSEALPGVRAVATPGHTPGHTSYLVSAGSGSLMVLGDVTSIPPLNLRNPGWHIVFDQDARMAEATRRRVFDQAVADKIVCAGYHWGMPGAGTIAKDGNGYALVPVA
ncbi:MAG: MBL fold metallo-hydrolase [Hyphomicrobiaceae bacterium]|nr:MBL fold metallo-hydrolase [Hyphomicrobiaceae bacterium]